MGKMAQFEIAPLVAPRVSSNSRGVMYSSRRRPHFSDSDNSPSQEPVCASTRRNAQQFTWALSASFGRPFLQRCYNTYPKFLQNRFRHVVNLPVLPPVRSGSALYVRTLSRDIKSLGDMAEIPRASPKVKRWEGDTRTISSWDGLRRDSQLWYDEGDCLVHLYAKGHSQRGPSFRIPFRLLQESNCDYLLRSSLDSTPSELLFSFPPKTENEAPNGKRELYIPAPDACPREDAFSFHITTRNFFAWLCGEPVVGINLGKALVDLLERMRIYRPDEDNIRDLVVYAGNAGYTKFGHYPDYALSMLYFAEHCELAAMYTDAFAHCVGTNEMLSDSPEFEPISKVSKALISRAYLEMDLHIGRVSKALDNFLEDDLSSAYLGLSQGARTHLDRFRSFLQAFYVEKYGYWPAPKDSAYPKALYRSMYLEFRNLYDYLADTESTHSIQSQKPAVGGICVLQNIKAFNARHKYAPLPHPLPLIPSAASGPRTQSQRAILALRLGKQSTKSERAMSVNNALAAATNNKDDTITCCPLVRAYMRFERGPARQEEKVSMADARRVRWILIYGVLQMLISVTRAPKEVRDAEDVTYPLCCLLAGTPPWKVGIKSLKKPVAQARSTIPEIPEYEHSSTPTFDIRPDCESNDYFNLNSRSNSNSSMDATYPSLKSIRNVRRFSQTSSRSSSMRSNNPQPRNDSVHSSCYGTKVLGAASIRPIGSLNMPTSPPHTTFAKSLSRLRPQSVCDILISDYAKASSGGEVGAATPVATHSTHTSLGAVADLDHTTTGSGSVTATKSLPDIPKPLPSWPKVRPKRIDTDLFPLSDVQRTPILEHFQLVVHDTESPLLRRLSLSSSPDRLSATCTSSPIESNCASPNRGSDGSFSTLPWSGEESNASDAETEDGPLPEMDHASLYSQGGIWMPCTSFSARAAEDAGPYSPVAGPASPTSCTSVDIPTHSRTTSSVYSRRVSFSSPFPPSIVRNPRQTSPSRTTSKSTVTPLQSPLKNNIPKPPNRSKPLPRVLHRRQQAGTFWLDEPDIGFDATQEVPAIGVAIGGAEHVATADDDDRPKTAWGVDMWGALEALNRSVSAAA